MSTDANSHRQHLVGTLVADEQRAVPDLNRDFRSAFLAFGSETPDNTSALDLVGLIVAPNPRGQPSRGLAIERHNILLADLLNAAEGTVIPVSVVETFPQLSQADWDAALRVATVVLAALEVPTPSQEP